MSSTKSHFKNHFTSPASLTLNVVMVHNGSCNEVTEVGFEYHPFMFTFRFLTSAPAPLWSCSETLYVPGETFQSKKVGFNHWFNDFWKDIMFMAYIINLNYPPTGVDRRPVVCMILTTTPYKVMVMAQKVPQVFIIQLLTRVNLEGNDK